MDNQRPVAMITGGASGIGRACAQLLLAQGANVIILDRSSYEQSSSDDALVESGQLLRLNGSVTSAADVRGAVEVAVARFGRLDMGINCAGITGALKPFVEQPDDALDELFSINVRGVFLAMKYQLIAMQRQTSGAIVNIASIFASRVIDSFGLYGASKHAVVGLTKAAAIEMAAKGIRVNAVAPGPIRTPFIGQLSELEEAQAAGSVPMKRLGAPNEVAELIVFLASPKATFVTGSIVAVDGGMSAQLFQQNK
jgi:NAD(P)-dependent dehydrogenase (short-subunit alcohol dehydrogenase family)